MSHYDQNSKSVQNAGQARIQHLVTGFSCEKRGCANQGQWYVTADDRAFHWCGTHTMERMHDNKFWATQVKRRLR